MLRLPSLALGAVVAASIFVITDSREARACGGCFHPPTTQNASVITDHRMALSVSTTQTVLWDQVRYSGDPQEFAWVLPVGQSAYIELARDEWLAALDAVSAPTISAPPLPSRCTSFGGGGGGGDGFACGASNASFAGGTDGSVALFDGGNGVQVISQDVVGPYLAVKIRSSSGEAITTWLTDNGFAIPSSVQPILDAYTNEGFDFIALKLAPGAGVQAMQPVRVVTAGADPTLPLRMVAAGIGSSVGLTLYVISEGRYEAANFANATIDPAKVVWDPTAARSNYSDLFTTTISGASTWVTEYAGAPGNLSQLYSAACLNKPSIPQPCADAGVDDASIDAATDDAASEAAADDASVVDAGDGGGCVDWVSACSDFTDWTVATTGMSPYDVHVTRLRTVLPSQALAVDLKLQANSTQANVSNKLTAVGYTNPDYDPCPNAPQAKDGCGCDTATRSPEVVTTSLGVIALLSLARRRRRAR